MTEIVYPWRVFVALAALGEVAVVLAVPRPLSLVVLVGASIATAATVGIGLFLAKRVQLGAPLLEAWLYGAPVPRGGSARLAGGLLFGAAVGAVVTAALRLLVVPAVPALRTRFVAEVALPTWKRWIIVFDAAVLEETLFRLFVLAAAAWLIQRLSAAPPGQLSLPTAWSSNLLAALAFALAHVPQWLAMAPRDPAVVITVLATNTAVGLVFGHLFVRKGIETAMAAHFGADVIVHVFGPAILAA
jgi:hypothetical protein